MSLTLKNPNKQKQFKLKEFVSLQLFLRVDLQYCISLIVIQDFYRLCSLLSYYRIMATFSMLYNRSLLLIYFIHNCLYLSISHPYPVPPLPLPTVIL